MLVDKSTAVVEHCCLLRSLPMKKRGGGRPCFDSLAGRWERRCGDRRRSLSLPFAPWPYLASPAEHTRRRHLTGYNFPVWTACADAAQGAMTDRS